MGSKAEGSQRNFSDSDKRDSPVIMGTNSLRRHLRLVLGVVCQLEELLLPVRLALRIAGKQPLGARADARLPCPLSLRPGWGGDEGQS